MTNSSYYSPDVEERTSDKNLLTVSSTRYRNYEVAETPGTYVLKTKAAHEYDNAAFNDNTQLYSSTIKRSEYHDPIEVDYDEYWRTKI